MMRDKEVAKIIDQEAARQCATLNLIPSENFVSSGVLRALGSVFTNKYAEGYPGARYYGGNRYADAIENLCRARALKLFGLSPTKWHVNVQPYSGSPANLAIYTALVPLGETIMGLRLDMGGHLTHGHKASFTGKAWHSAQYGVDKKTERLDYKAILAFAKKEKPRLIVAGFTAYTRVIDFKKFRAIANAVHAYFVVDMSHFAGLVAGKAYPSPFPHADVVMTTTHKTLRGPRGAMIFVKREAYSVKHKTVDLAKAIDRAVFPGLQGGPHMNQIAATAVALREAAEPNFRTYARQVVKNARVLAAELQKYGFRIISGGTDTHLLLVDVSAKGIGGNPSINSGRPLTGREASDKLEKNGIIVNKNTIPYDTRPPMDPSGIRLGTPALTTCGMKEKEMKRIAKLIAEVLINNRNVASEVRALSKKFCGR